ncbi:MAG TPA: SPOR domain-containing protein [Gemmatimonadaceae bacterium]|nr:SPOR domain-containing protein [Gemmatimonadaceae bacterium]
MADALDTASAVVVLGHDPIATASVALGIGRAQAARRRVAVGDLIGDVAPLRGLVTDDDPHGLTDAFLYGVSLNKIARQIDTAGNLHILPSGSEPVAQEEVLHNDRWRRLASGFGEVGALLLIAAPAAIPGVEALIGMLDGVVLVGGAASPVPNAHVFTEVTSPARRSAPRTEKRKAAVATAPTRRRWVVPVAAAAVIAAVAVLLGRNYLTRPPATPVQALRRDSAAASDSLIGGAPLPIDSSPPLTVANPADSAIASPFAVQIAMVDTEDGASMRVRAGGGDFPVGTYAPVSRGSDRGVWYKVVTGAYTDRSRAEQLLAFLRTRGLVPQGWGSVIRAPIGLLVTTAPSETEAAALIADYQSRQIPVYGLMQRDATIRIYSGAFETPDEAALAKSALKSTKNIDATLAYRVGRAY